MYKFWFKQRQVSKSFRIFAHKHRKYMIVTGNTVTTNQSTKSVSTTEHVMATTMSVDEYFDELISQVHEDYADL